MGIPAMGPMCSARSSLVARGRPKSRLIAFVDKAMGCFPAMGKLGWNQPTMELSHGAAAGE
jgi:hypothetical protein